MQNLVPHFILENYAAGVYSGQMQVASLFVDISGFSAITNALSQHGSETAEVMADAMCRIFDPLVDAVYARGGFITTFAGDAFTALFPQAMQQVRQDTSQDIVAAHSLNALAAALAIQAHMVAQPVQETPYGRFPFAVKLGMGEGKTNWGILLPDAPGAKASYYFSGPAVESAAAAEHYAQPGNIVLSKEFAAALAGQVKTLPTGEDGCMRLLALNKSVELPEPAELSPARAWPCEEFFIPETILQREQRGELQNGEFRQVVSVFINLMGIHDSQDLAPFMQAVFVLQHQFGGYLTRVDFGDKGCNLLLFWGTPTSTEQDMESALQFTLALGEHTPGSYKAGITYYMVYAGLAGSARRCEWTCYGDGINLAARLMVAAPWGGIWLDERVANRAGCQFVIEKVGDYKFKGFAEAQPVYTLLEQGSVEFTEMFQGQMVGRQAELARLHEFIRPLFAPPGEKRFAGLLAVEGEPGLGKSRLVAEFLRSVSCVPLSNEDDGEKAWNGQNGIRSTLCQADPRVREPLNPFRYWLRRHFGQSTSESAARNKRAFGRIFDQLLAGLPDLDLQQELNRGRSFLGELIGLHWENSPYAELDPQGRYEITFSALKAFILAESLRCPLVLNVEDAHCLDDDSLAFIKRLVREVDAYPLAILATARSRLGNIPLFDELSYQRLELAPLKLQEVEELAQQLLGGTPHEALVALLDERAEGNPFFAEQILLYLREGGHLVRINGAWHLSERDLQDVLPADVRTVFTARLDCLDTDVKETVQAAAVLGREFDVQVLSHMLQDDPRLPDKLRRAEGEAIWKAISAMRYLFKHGLLRDAAYEMQLRSWRREMHYLAATALEHVYGQEHSVHYQEIAYHYESAYQQGLEKARQPACRYLQNAGQRAAAAYENAVALDFYSRALNLLNEVEDDSRYVLLLAREEMLHLMGERAAQAADLQALEGLTQSWQRPAEQADVHLRQARLASVTGDYAVAIEQAQAAAQKAQAAGQVNQEAAACLAWGEALWRQGSYAPAEERLKQALALARAAAQLEMETRVLHSLGSVAFHQSAYERASQHYQASLELAEALEKPALQARALLSLGNVALHQGHYPLAWRYYEQGLVFLRQVGDRMGEGKALNNLGVTSQRQGDYDAARDYYAQGLAIARQVNDRTIECMLLSNLGDVASDQGDYARARQDYSQSLEQARQMGNRQSEGIGLGSLGTVAHRQGDLAAADAYLQDSLTIFKQLGNRWAEAVGLNYLAAVDLSRGDTQAARAHFIQSLELARQLGDLHNQSRALDGLGRAALRQGEAQEATSYCQQSLELARQVGDRDGEGKTLHNLAQASLALGQLEQARSAFDQALALRQQLHQPQHAAEDLAGLAQTAWRCDDTAQARGYLDEMLSILAEFPALEGAENPFWAFLSAVHLLLALEDERGAPLLMQIQERLLAQGERLADEAAQRLFFEEVPENRALLAETLPGPTVGPAAVPGAPAAQPSAFQRLAQRMHTARIHRRVQRPSQPVQDSPPNQLAASLVRQESTPQRIAHLDAAGLEHLVQSALASAQSTPGTVIVIHIEQVSIENVHVSGNSQPEDK